MVESSDMHVFLLQFLKEQKTIYTFILRHTEGIEQTREVFQDTVERMWVSYKHRQSTAEFSSWGIDIARTLIARRGVSQDTDQRLLLQVGR